VPATVVSAGERTLTVALELPIRAITPGQSGVLCNAVGRVLGGE
jgi:tRNA U34 2-thiouridine synthase MnmA/TrmU